MLARAVKQSTSPLSCQLCAGIDTDKALLVEKGSDLYVEYLVARPDNIQDPAFRNWRKRCIRTPFVSSF